MLTCNCTLGEYFDSQKENVDSSNIADVNELEHHLREGNGNFERFRVDLNRY